MGEFNLAKVFTTVAEAVPDQEVLIWRDRRFTYRQLDERTNRVANLLLDHGVTVNEERSKLAGHESGQDHVGLYLRNGNEYLEGMIGAYRARSAPFNVNYRYVTEELLYLLSDARAKAIIYSAEFAPTLAEVRDDLPLGAAHPGCRRIGQRAAPGSHRLRRSAGSRFARATAGRAVT